MTVRVRALRWAVLAAISMGSALAAQEVPGGPDYAPVVAAMRVQIKREMETKKLPAVAIALVDGQRTVWAQGFGFEDEAHTRPADAHTIFRIGSVSKLFTDLAVMQMVERKQLDLDAPVERYLSEFKPANSFGTPITLRELMSHRAGLLREPPVGHYFDDSSPTLAATIASLNETALVAKPGTLTKYSNAGVATVGYVLERMAKQPFAEYMKGAVLAPLGMHESAFSSEASMQAHMAQGRMWSYDGLDFAAPTFPLGEAPAGAMYSSVGDLALFVRALLADGRGPGGQIVSPESLHAMWKPQFGGQFGLGFALGELDERPEVSHAGAIYGFATELALLPEDKLGVVVVTTVDSANAVTNHLAELALRQMLALHKGQPLPTPAADHEIEPGFAREAQGEYRSGHGEVARLEESRAGLSLFRGAGLLEDLRGADQGLIRDGRLSYSAEPIATTKDSLHLSSKEYRRMPVAIPAALSPEWGDLIGEYGWDYDKLYVLEDRGKLNILVEWFDFEPLEPVSRDQFQLPARGLYQSETVTFLRDGSGAVTGAKIGSVVFKRRSLPAGGEVFQIKPQKPVEQLRREALASQPPVEKGEFLSPDLVQLNQLDPTIKLDIRYATTRNFLAAPLYLQSRAYMQRPAAEAVVRVSQHLHALGYGLLIHDSYRPWYVTNMFWEGTPPDKRIFVADPSQGSRHNRGCAVDLTLYELKSGQPIVATGGYDEMSERSYPFYPGGTARQRYLRDLLRDAMEAEGFTVYEFEWWHFDYKDWRKYPILNKTFEELESKSQP